MLLFYKGLLPGYFSEPASSSKGNFDISEEPPGLSLILVLDRAGLFSLFVWTLGNF